MQLTDQQKSILSGKICPYCKSESQLVFADGSKHYKYVGWFRVCRPCRAWVGCHRNTQNALGRLANKELRVLKMETHKAFDPIWKDGFMARKEAYRWLSEQLDIPEKYVHIGMFGAETCKIVARISRFKYLQLKTNLV